MNFAARLTLVLGLAVGVSVSARGQLIFSDNFDAGASGSWSNTLGTWSATGGVYSATVNSSNPPTYSSLPFDLTDFSVTVTVNALKDGGIWLRSSSNANGIVLITGGHGGTGDGLYWHEIVGGNWSSPSVLNEVTGLFTSGVSNPVITITVIGNTYSAYVNGSATPATTLTSTLFTHGNVGLYDFSIQTFDNFSVTAIPEPANVAAVAAGFALAVAWWARRRRAELGA